MFDNNDSDDSSTDADTNADTLKSYAESVLGIGTDAEDDTQHSNPDSKAARKWGLGAHSAQPVVSEADLQASAEKLRGLDDDMAEMFENAADMVGSQKTSLGRYECPVCGIEHKHGSDKHDIRDTGSDGLYVDPDFAERMEFNPNCHCGVNELAMLMDFLDHIPVQVFTDISNAHVDGVVENRKADVRGAAANATISEATENRIENIRESIEASLDTDEPVTDGGYVMDEP